MRFYSIFYRVSCQTQNFNNIFSEKIAFSWQIEPQFRSQKRQIWFKSLPPPQKRDWHLLVPSIFRFSKKREKRRKTKKTRENPGFFEGHLFWPQNLARGSKIDALVFFRSPICIRIKSNNLLTINHSTSI